MRLIWPEDADKNFWETQGLAVVNHTVSDYHTALARQPSQSTSRPHVQIRRLVAVCRNENHIYSTMYDAIPMDPQRRSIRTSSVYTFTGSQFRTTTPVQRCSQKGAILSAFVTSRGRDGKFHGT